MINYFYRKDEIKLCYITIIITMRYRILFLTSQILWYIMCDDMAREMGVYPSFWRLLLRSPAMALKVSENGSCKWRQ